MVDLPHGFDQRFDRPSRAPDRHRRRGGTGFILSEEQAAAAGA
jgi:hypothetical protein